MGVWIETAELSIIALRKASHPVWVCGLKQNQFAYADMTLKVTPCMGVWIETDVEVFRILWCHVTPCMGVWIETIGNRAELSITGVTPCMGVWIETSGRP